MRHLITSFLCPLLLFSISVSAANRKPAQVAKVRETKPSEESKSELLVNADQMNTDFKTRISQLTGNVQVVFHGQHLSCDRAIVYYREKRIEAFGNIRVQSPMMYLEASKMVYNFEKDTATMEDGLVQSGQVVFEGKRVEKTGVNTFLVTEATYTACVSCPPAWSFSGKKIEAELGGYAKIQRPVMRIGGVPVVILPSILVPLKSDRQSGFLVPSVDFSKKGGLAISESFFWAISRSQDMTLTLKNYGGRGIKGLGEYRYVLDPESKGHLNMGYIRDRGFGSEPLVTEKTNRWFGRYEHYYALPNDYTQRLSLNQVSDLRYTRDFPDEMPGHGDPALENRISLTKTTSGQLFSIEADFYKNLLKQYPLASNDDAVNRLPEIRYALTDRRVLESPILFRLDTTYTKFARNGFSYDDLSSTTCKGDVVHCALVGNESKVMRDGQFNENVDKIRTGSRLDIRPMVSLPFSLFKIIEVTPAVSFREMQYQFDSGLDFSSSPNSNFAPSAAQRYIEAGVSAKTSLSRVYGDLSQVQSSRIRHEVEPQVSFSTIPWLRRPDHAFFGNFAGQRYARIDEPISDADLYGPNGLQFDYEDRVFDKQLVDLALTNRLTRKRWRDGVPYYERIFTFRLSESYDLNEARNEDPKPWSAINGLLNVRLDHFETYTAASYNPYAKVTNTSARVKVFDRDRINFLQASYERIYLIDADNKVIPTSNQTENIGLGLGFDTKYVGFSGQFDYSAVTSRIQSWRYVALFKPPGNCWTIRLDQWQLVGAPPEFHFTVAFNFGGETAPKVVSKN